jgi:hypothetical protein
MIPNETPREKLIRKIAALRAKAMDPSVTEAEAMSFAAKVSEMMEVYEIEEADLALAEKRAFSFDIGRDDMKAGERQAHRVGYVLRAIGRLCRVQFITDKSAKTPRFVCVGDRPDREAAIYLAKVIMQAMESEYARYKLATGEVGRSTKHSFQLGMAVRLNERIMEMVRAREQAQRAATGTALVLVDQKRALVQDEFSKLFPKVRMGRASSARRGGAFGAGKVAGDRVNLSRGLGGGSRQISG